MVSPDEIQHVRSILSGLTICVRDRARWQRIC